jgi:hypothetical protein
VILGTLQLASLLVAALTLGVFWGPWIGLTRTLAGFDTPAFLAIVHRMDRNLGSLMTVLFPLTIASIAAVLLASAGGRPAVFALSAAGLVCFLLALVVTMRIEVPIVTRIRAWTASTLPADWQAQRDRWVSFHLARVLSGFAGFGLLAAGAVFSHA